MDEEHTAGYRESCAVCSAVDWGVSAEGHFYCRSCHNVIERTREEVDTDIAPGSSRVNALNKGPRTKKSGGGHEWVICEGFQFILRNQASALVRLGVHPGFKDDVLCQLWRIYLQKTGQAYAGNPARTARLNVRGLNSDSESAAELSAMSAGETDDETNLSNAGSRTGRDRCSGSLDAANYLTAGLTRNRDAPMTMKKTLALIHIALVWSREPLTLSDLLRLVNEGHVPYVHAYEDFPDEMKLSGKDGLIFKDESIPTHQHLHREAHELLTFLQLPAFPPISRQSLLHPALLSLRYLMDVNLPDELHLWVVRVMERADLADQKFHTIEHTEHPVLPRYDLQAAAFIIVTMKLVFGLDDHTEWDLSSEASDQDDTGNMFNLRRWFRLLQAALIPAQQRRDRDIARKQWTPNERIFSNKKHKWGMLKKKRTAEQVRTCFEKLSSCPVDGKRVDPSSFLFCWGDEDGADGPSLHQKKLDGVLTLKDDVLAPTNSTYWQPLFKEQMLCRPVYLKLKPRLPRMFVWLLELFCFLLDVKPLYLLDEVLRVEKRLIINISRRTLSNTKRRMEARNSTRAREASETGKTS